MKENGQEGNWAGSTEGKVHWSSSLWIEKRSGRNYNFICFPSIKSIILSFL